MGMVRTLLWGVLLSLVVTSARAEALDLGGLRLEVAGVEDVQIGLSGTEAVVVLSLERTRWPPLTLTDAALDILVSGEAIGQATVVEDRTRLRRGRVQEVRLQCSLSALSGLGALSRGLSRGELSFRLKGEVKGRVLGIIPKRYTLHTPVISL